MPLVSVVMPVFNGERYIAEAIDSIMSQTFADFELLIVDDGSKDVTVDIVRGYQEHDDRIRLFQLQRNKGKADARNRGIAAAAGAYIAQMDCDDISLPLRLEKQVAFLQTNPGFGAVGTCARVINHDSSTSLFDFIVPQQHALIALNMFFGASLVGASVMMRREFLTKVGGYEPGRMYGDDLELFLRLLWQTPIKFANLNEVLYLYRKHEASASANRGAAGDLEIDKVRETMLLRLWTEAPADTLDRFGRLFKYDKLNRAQRRAAKQDMRRLIESMIAHKWVDSGDRPLLVAEMNRRLEQASPRLWQQFCHWRRHHFH